MIHLYEIYVEQHFPSQAFSGVIVDLLVHLIHMIRSQQGWFDQTQTRRIQGIVLHMFMSVSKMYFVSRA